MVLFIWNCLPVFKTFTKPHLSLNTKTLNLERSRRAKVFLHICFDQGMFLNENRNPERTYITQLFQFVQLSFGVIATYKSFHQTWLHKISHYSSVMD